jgi:hypothetical protein
MHIIYHLFIFNRSNPGKLNTATTHPLSGATRRFADKKAMFLKPIFRYWGSIDWGHDTKIVS